MDNKQAEDVLIRCTSDIVSAFLARNQVSGSEIQSLISTVHQALAACNGQEETPKVLEPAVPVKKSVTPDYIICLEDGARLKMLKRYISTRYKMTPDQYREKWGLPKDYPMTAPNYSKKRSQFAKDAGLGQRESKSNGTQASV